MLDWSKYSKVADKLQHKARYQDREDLNHTIVLSLANAQLAKDNNGGGELSDVAMLRIGTYECQKYWRQQKRLLTISSLNSEIDDGDGNTTELIETIADDKAIDLQESADGFRLAIVNLDYDDGEGEALISRDDLKGVSNALKRAKRARVSFGNEDVTIPSSLIIDTELIRYKWVSVGGSFPEYEKLIPTEFNYSAHLDTIEAIKAVNSLKSFATDKAYPLDLDIGDGKVVMTDPDGKGIAELVADTDGTK